MNKVPFWLVVTGAIVWLTIGIYLAIHAIKFIVVKSLQAYNDWRHGRMTRTAQAWQSWRNILAKSSLPISPPSGNVWRPPDPPYTMDDVRGRPNDFPAPPPNIVMQTGVAATDSVLRGLEQALHNKGQMLPDLIPTDIYGESVLALGLAICDSTNHMTSRQHQPCHVCCEVAEGLLERLEADGYWIGS